MDVSYYRVLETRGRAQIEVSRHRSLEEARRRFRARGRAASWRIQDPTGHDVTDPGDWPSFYRH